MAHTLEPLVDAYIPRRHAPTAIRVDTIRDLKAAFPFRQDIRREA
jgi:hypothetical protein